MSRLILATLLITVVFSWEDLKWSLLRIAKTIQRKQHYAARDNQTDQLVGAVLILAFTPVNLVYLMLGEGSIYGKFALIAAQLIVIGIVAQLAQIVSSRGEKYRNVDLLSGAIHFVSGVFSPSLRLGSQIVSHHHLFGSYIRHLLVPIGFGFFLKFLVQRYSLEAIESNLDILIMVVVAGMLLVISMDLLEKFFRIHKFKLFGYYRIVLGIAILLALTQGLVIS